MKFMRFKKPNKTYVIINLSMISSIEISTTNKKWSYVILNNNMRYELDCSMDKLVVILNAERVEED